MNTLASEHLQTVQSGAPFVELQQAAGRRHSAASCQLHKPSARQDAAVCAASQQHQPSAHAARLAELARHHNNQYNCHQQQQQQHHHQSHYPDDHCNTPPANNNCATDQIDISHCAHQLQQQQQQRAAASFWSTGGSDNTWQSGQPRNGTLASPAHHNSASSVSLASKPQQQAAPKATVTHASSPVAVQPQPHQPAPAPAPASLASSQPVANTWAQIAPKLPTDLSQFVSDDKIGTSSSGSGSGSGSTLSCHAMTRETSTTVATNGRSSSKAPSSSLTPKDAPGQQQQRRHVGVLQKFAVDCFMCVLRAFVSLYDLVSVPVFYYAHDVAALREEVEQVRSVKLAPHDPNSAWRQINISARQRALEAHVDTFETYDQLMRASLQRHAKLPCYAFRRVLSEQFVHGASAKPARLLHLSDYEWVSYEQFETQIEAARKGLLLEGVRAGHKVILFSDTRAEWQIASQALMRIGAIVCTMYSTLGVDGIVHTLNETAAQLVITQQDKVERLLALRAKLPTLSKIVFFDVHLRLPAELSIGVDDSRQEHAFERRQQELDSKWAELMRANGPAPGQTARLECVRFYGVLERGAQTSERQLAEQQQQASKLAASPDQCIDAPTQPARRTRNSLALIMYTSGSTGVPKGVLISHGNILATIKSFSYVVKDFAHKASENVCVAYLPLAHIFGFCIDSVMLYNGVRFGFATPHTLTDKSVALAAGQLGDLSLLKPTVMIIVPLILDRVAQGVRQTLAQGPYFKQRLVTYLIEYKMRWQRRFYETPIVDRLVCNKINAALGGRAKYLICGSAPLSAQTQTFIRAALNVKLPQGLGTTETCSATSCQLFDDQSTENVGLPVSGCFIKLEPWHEANYLPDDKPNSRGEIVVGGEMIAHGYFNLAEQTREQFYVDEHNCRWYRTGDIGEMLPNGQLRIIDRKKDLVKLQNGEYISLGRVESTLKANPYTDNFCVYANSRFNYVVALGPANEAAITQLARQLVDGAKRTAAAGAAKPRKRPPAHENQSLLGDELAGDELTLAVDELCQILAHLDSAGRTSQQSAHAAPQLAPVCGADKLFEQLCANKLIVAHVLEHMTQVARQRNLLTLEIPKKLLLLAEDWTEDKNLVTAAMKIRRNFIYKRYQSQLDCLYAHKT